MAFIVIKRPFLAVFPKRKRLQWQIFAPAASPSVSRHGASLQVSTEAASNGLRSEMVQKPPFPYYSVGLKDQPRSDMRTTTSSSIRIRTVHCIAVKQIYPSGSARASQLETSYSCSGTYCDEGYRGIFVATLIHSAFNPKLECLWPSNLRVSSIRCHRAANLEARMRRCTADGMLVTASTPNAAA